MIPSLSHLAEAGPAADPLSPAEMEEMKAHLAFIRNYKEVLRLKLNAGEDLLVNGRREATDRGVCRHLLGKIDRAVIEGAVGREPLKSDAAARARMLAGAIRLTADLSVLLAYLETLAHVRSHAEAAQAFGEVVSRIDFESLSATRLGRLLQVLIQTFTDHERVQVLFSLLAQPAFRRAFDTAAPSLPPEVAAAFLPLRAVHRRILEADATQGEGAERAPDASSAAAPASPGGPESETPAQLAAGLEQLLSAPDPVLRSYAEPLRIGILQLVLGAGIPEALADRASSVLLGSLPRTGRLYARLALRRAAQLLARHADDRARAVLTEVHRAQPGFHLPERWLAALDARHVGRVALAGGIPERGRLAPAFWLDGQRPMWVRTAASADADRVAAEARLQMDLALPAIAPLVEHGVASGIPYVAVAGAGQPLAPDAAHPLERAAALALAATAVRVLRGLALAGVTLPDAAPERFLCTTGPSPTLVLADLDGARVVDPEDAARQLVAVAVELTRALVPANVIGTLATEYGTDLRDSVAAPVDLGALVRALDHAALRSGRE